MRDRRGTEAKGGKMKRRPIVKTEMWYNLTKRNSMGCFCSRKSNHSEASRGEEH